MENQLLHTPEGVRDIYNGECERKLADSRPDESGDPQIRLPSDSDSDL